ncbi:MAG: hypothetical protein NWS01_04770 [Burkholderiales bacterium]|nr:hypothetical protein [Burkholderiales bacterium]
MAAPNIKSLTVINGKSAAQAVTTAAADLVVNTAASGKVLKVNAMYISNTTAGDLKVNVTFKRGATSFHIAKDIVVPKEASLDLLRKHIYLEEGDSIQVQGSAAGMEAVAGYEELQ